jgi:hypothetical protein
MRSYFICFFILFHCSGFAQIPAEKDLKNGDLLFQDLDCGPLCDAIEQVTISYGKRHFSHLGMVYVKHDSIFVLEAIGNSVRLTPLAAFRARTTHPMLAARVKAHYKSLVPKAISFAEHQLGVPYDDAYLYDNGKYYCSELIYDAFKAAQNGKDFFVLQPMTFKQPGTQSFFPAWITYYRNLKIPIPEGMPGINPGGISMSPLLDILSK